MLIIILLPFVLAAILLPFFGGAPIVIVTTAYIHIFAWPFGVGDEFYGKVSYQETLERSSVFECYHIAVKLALNTQSQPFALSDDDNDWQPRVGGPPAVQPTGNKAWMPTPLEENLISRRITEMKRCGLSSKTIDAVRVALKKPGSWIAFSPRGMDKILIYSQPLKMAVVYSNEK